MYYKECFELCPYYESEREYMEERLASCYETLIEPPACTYGGEPYEYTKPHRPCIHGLGR